jgi:broad specificity phosphatase PhoE
MDTGVNAGVPLQNLRFLAPDEYYKWAVSENPVTHRITGGESLADVVVRLEPVVLELERLRKPVLVISHLSAIQVLLSYFRGVPLRNAPKIHVPMHSVVELVPQLYGWTERLWFIGPTLTKDLE